MKPEQKPIGYDIEQKLIRRMEERYREGQVSEAVAEFFENVGNVNEIPLLMGREKRKLRTIMPVGGGGEVRREVPAANGHESPNTLYPPTTNRGVTFHGEAFEQQNTDCPHIMGGYDGGVEIGFNGKWNKADFLETSQILSQAKEAAQENGNPEKNFILGGLIFTMHAKSAGGHITYKYIFEGNGVKFYVHSNPVGEIQPVRVRYNAEGLIGRDLFFKHRETLEFLKEIGFTVTEEKLSRVDMQVMIYRDISEFMESILDQRYVCTAQKYSVNGSSSNTCPDTFTLGQAIQVCIYDKRRELFEHMRSEPYKFALMVRECFGDEWLVSEVPTTRVEFRLRREVLKDMEINTMEDLLEHEAGLARYCCYSWFRIISEQKHKGHTHEQKVSELWQEVQAEFEKYFPGVQGHNQDVSRNKKKIIRCHVEALEKQAIGCMATASALMYGTVSNTEESVKYVIRKIEENASKLCNRAYERALELGIKIGIVEEKELQKRHTVPDYSDWIPLGQPLLCSEFND